MGALPRVLISIVLLILLYFIMRIGNHISAQLSKGGSASAKDKKILKYCRVIFVCVFGGVGYLLLDGSRTLTDAAFVEKLPCEAKNL
jgi:hypothetical protein